MSEQSHQLFEFGPFRLDETKRLLSKEGETVPLTPKAFETLLTLVRHSGQVLEKDQMMKDLWPDSFVEEANLTQNISTVRKALGENPQEHRYIVTVPGRGYRFVANVKKSWDEETELVIEERTHSHVVINAEEVADIEIESGRRQTEKGVHPLPLATAKALTAPTTFSFGHPGTIPKIGRRVIVTLVLGAVALSGAAYSVYKLIGRRNQPSPFAQARLQRLTTTGRAHAAAISPDGKQVAYVTNDSGAHGIWIRQVATTNEVQIVSSSDAWLDQLTFSPDGTYVYYVSSKRDVPPALFRVSSLGGTSFRLLGDIDTPITFSPDGKRFAFIRGYPDQGEAALMTASVDGTNERRLATLAGKANYYLTGKGPAWSPDGKVIACSAKAIDEGGEYHHVLGVRPEDGSVTPLHSRRWTEAGRIAWLPSATGFVMTAADADSAPARQLWFVDYVSGEVRRITNDLDDYKDVSIASDGKSLVAVQVDQIANIWIGTNPDQSDSQKITSSNYDGVTGLAWTPDGRIIYVTRAGETQNLWIMDGDGRDQRQFIESVGANSDPAVSPDGKSVVFSSNRAGRVQLWWVDADGNNARQLTNGVDETHAAFSPDGQWVVYKSYINGNPNVLRVNINSGEKVLVTNKISGRPVVSPDGKLVVCVYRDPALSPNRVGVVPFEGGTPIKLFDFFGAPFRWSPDGQAYTYIKTVGGVSNIWLQPLDGSPTRQLTNFKSDRIFSYAWSHGRERLAVARGRITSDIVLMTDWK